MLSGLCSKLRMQSTLHHSSTSYCCMQMATVVIWLRGRASWSGLQLFNYAIEGFAAKFPTPLNSMPYTQYCGCRTLCIIIVRLTPGDWLSSSQILIMSQSALLYKGIQFGRASIYFLFFYCFIASGYWYLGMNSLAAENLLSDVSALGQASALRCRELIVFSHQLEIDYRSYV